MIMEPLPRPQYERMNLPDDQHMAFWRQVIRDFDWAESRRQSIVLYSNRIGMHLEGDPQS